jgi:integrase/recombinase XerD
MTKTYPVPCSKEEISRIIDATIEDDFCNLLFTIAKKTGRRLGEYYDVQVKDINYERKVMMTKVLKRRKKVEKEALLDDELIQLLKRYIAKEKLKLDDYIFRKYSYRQIQNKIKSYAKIAGINHNVSFHNFRHYFITELFKKGWTYDKIAKLTGHSSPGTLAEYDHTVATDIADKAFSDIKDL